MKKAMVLLLVLVAAGAFAFAQDAAAPQQPKYSLTGDATVAWAYNLTDSTSGFTNSYDVELKYFLLDNAKATKGGEGTYGQIDITHLNLRVDTSAKGVEPPVWTAKDADGNNISIAAKIVSGALSVGVFGAPSADYENAVFVPLFSPDAGYADSSALEPTLSTTGGTYVAYSLGDLGSVKVSVASVAAVAAAAAGTATTVETVYIGTGTETAVDGTAYYAAADATLTTALTPPLVAGTIYRKVVTTAGSAAVVAADGYYLGGIDLTLNPVKDVLAITAGGWYDPTLEKLVATVKASVTAGALSAYAAADIQNTADLVFDVSGQVAYALNEKKDTFSLDAYYYSDEAVAHQADFGVKFVDAEGFVPGLSFTVGAFGNDMLGGNDPMLLSVAQSLSYKIGDTKIKPYEAVRYDLTGALMYLNVGVEYDAVANTAIKGEFIYGATQDDNNVNLVAADTPSKIKISAKITL